MHRVSDGDAGAKRSSKQTKTESYRLKLEAPKPKSLTGNRKPYLNPQK